MAEYGAPAANTTRRLYRIVPSGASAVSRNTHFKPTRLCEAPESATATGNGHDFGSDWFQQNSLLTGMLNAYTLLVPDNERYYIRALANAMQSISTETQKQEIRKFIRQESSHGEAHRAFWATIPRLHAAERYFLRPVNFLLYRVLEPLQLAWLRLSIVAAIEHINASWAAFFLGTNAMQDAPRDLKRLFEWHFIEEMEHKHVAHEALTSVVPGLQKRRIGAVFAFPLFSIILLYGAFVLSAKELLKSPLSTARTAILWSLRSGFLRANAEMFIAYMRRDFDPRAATALVFP
jgi:predicted metal-dependent hydrolase